jgi:parallel beta-helix repeat protein
MEYLFLFAHITMLALQVSPQPQTCQASMYPGATGKDKIQAAINDKDCPVVEIATVGPDAGGTWTATGDITLRSNLILQGPTTGAKPTIQAAAGYKGAGMFRGDNLSNVTIRQLVIDGGTTFAPNAIWVRGCDHFTVVQNTIRNLSSHGLHFTVSPCSDLQVRENTFAAAGGVAVRVDTAVNTNYHARVTVTGNAFSGSNYGVALQNCGTDAGTACVVSTNTFVSPALSAVDFNRVNYGSITNNVLSGTLARGITIDDATHNTISGNTVPATADYGIVIANGAVAGNKPWSVSFNVVSGNTVSGSAGTALMMGASADPTDRNDHNTFSDNTISGNAVGCHQSPSVANATWARNGPQPCTP